jgi:hypothetical protein
MAREPWIGRKLPKAFPMGSAIGSAERQRPYTPTLTAIDPETLPPCYGELRRTTLQCGAEIGATAQHVQIRERDDPGPKPISAQREGHNSRMAALMRARRAAALGLVELAALAPPPPPVEKAQARTYPPQKMFSNAQLAREWAALEIESAKIAASIARARAKASPEYAAARIAAAAERKARIAAAAPAIAAAKAARMVVEAARRAEIDVEKAARAERVTTHETMAEKRGAKRIKVSATELALFRSNVGGQFGRMTDDDLAAAKTWVAEWRRPVVPA